MPPSAYEISWFGDRCLRVCFGEQNTPETRVRVLSAFRLIESEDFEKRFSLTPAYTTLLVRFHPLAVREPERTLRTILESHPSGACEVEFNLIEIPVCYDADFAPDLESVASHAGIAPPEVVRRHSGAAYQVAFVGFTPGFGYLTGLPAELAAPRLPNPRTRVPAGSVGIAGDQTGIYPSATPGGWRLIGRTPLRLFDAHRANPSLLSIGDSVRFRAIDRAEFESIHRTIEGSV
ncbi:MAG: 5-oxoprolinase subunit PxpB [Phycisphaerales bacterium]|nr:5-oxoprolinase subunit PxpB [Phycisphaerales bacterium]